MRKAKGRFGKGNPCPDMITVLTQIISAYQAQKEGAQ